jgi:hypothetical protein
MASKPDLHIRKFLNENTGTALIEVTLEQPSYDEDSIEAEVKFSDCFRTATIDFCYRKNAKDRRRVVKKLNLIIDSLVKLREEIYNN